MITIDTSDLNKGIERLLKETDKANKKGMSDVAEEVLRLSQFEVPHDKGLLQNSGHVEAGDNEYIVGYNKVYAARLHEHPEYKFQKGRKGKYLEDPIKNNTDTLLEHYARAIGGMF
jgi:hypothetical protein